MILPVSPLLRSQLDTTWNSVLQLRSSIRMVRPFCFRFAPYLGAGTLSSQTSVPRALLLELDWLRRKERLSKKRKYQADELEIKLRVRIDKLERERSGMLSELDQLRRQLEATGLRPFKRRRLDSGA